MVIRVRCPAALLVLMALLAGGCDKEMEPCALPVNGEMRGTGTLWALFFPTADQPAPVVANQEAKIVWKIGGTGAFTIKAAGPDGTGWRLPAPGCWTFTAQRESGEKGVLRLTVA